MKQIKRYDGTEFEFKVAEKNSISVLEPGYIITPDGEFIPVTDKENHGDIFSKYLTKYLNSSEELNLEALEACRELLKLNHIVYIGIRGRNMKIVYTNGGGRSRDFGMFLLPENYQQNLTKEQKASSLTLLNTNKSIFGNRPIMDINIQYFNDQIIEMSDFLQCLEFQETKKMNKR